MGNGAKIHKRRVGAYGLALALIFILTDAAQAQGLFEALFGGRRVAAPHA